MNLPLILLGAVGAYLVLDRKKSPKTSSTLKSTSNTTDNGFIYDCKSITILNLEKFRWYIVNTIQSNIELHPQFKNPNTINFSDFVSECLQSVNKTCFNNLAKNPNKNEKLTAGFLADGFISGYLILQFGEVAGTFSLPNIQEKPATEESQIQYDEYYSSYVLPQLEEILKKFDTSKDEIEFISDSIVSSGGNKFPPDKSVLDKGFKYDCKSLEITNNTFVTVYTDNIVKTVISLPEFQDIYTLDIKNFALECFKRFDKNCYNKLVSKTLKGTDLKLAGYILSAFISVYKSIQLSKLENFPIQEQEQFEKYIETNIEPQRLQLLDSLGLTDFDLNIVQTTLEANGGKYP